MISIKNKQEIEKMKKGGKILSEVMAILLNEVREGVSEEEIEKLANELIIKKNAFPGFKKVKGYKWATCISTNDEVVHGLPGKYIFKEGDVVCIDCGVFYEGLNTDMSETIEVKSSKLKVKSSKKDEMDKFLETGKRALDEGIKQAKQGNRIGHISKKIQDIVEKEGGYSVVRNLVGHGIGKNLHEEPEIPGFLRGSIEKTPLIREGMTLAIEVIYNMGKKEVEYGEDGWTIKTRDKSPSAVFERTIAVEKSGPTILT